MSLFTGHGNVVFSSSEAENLRNYLLGGGFLHIDDNYGMDPFIRTEIKKVFPEADLVEAVGATSSKGFTIAMAVALG